MARPEGVAVTEPKGRLATLVTFDHWSWVFFIVWFGAVTVLTATNSPISQRAAYWGIVLVIINNFARLLLLSDHFRITRKMNYWRLSLVLVVILLGSIVLQYLIRK
jgi:hypothetical protein